MRVFSLDIPPDKSISHRAIMLASIAEGTTHIKNLLMGDDCLRTIDAFRAMGVPILFESLDFARDKLRREQNPSSRLRHLRCLRSKNICAANIIVHGVGMRGLKKPSRPIYLGNSGTTMRILPGILAGQDFSVTLKGDKSLSKRPMRRIVEPLRDMGSEIRGTRGKGQGTREKEFYPPLKIHGGKLKAIKYKSKIASAQVKSCILLAGLFADGVTSVAEPVKSRDHTERMLKMFGCRFKSLQTRIAPIRGAMRVWRERVSSRVILNGPCRLKSPGTIEIPGDISSAAFFIVAGCIMPDTKIILKNIGLNPTRCGVLDILRRMGADIRVDSSQLTVDRFYEPAGDIIVKSSRLKGVSISPEEVVRAIDEIPIIMVAASLAKGKTVIKGAGELRVKETDRIKSMVTNLRRMGGDIRVLDSPALSSSSIVEKKKVVSRSNSIRSRGAEVIVINGVSSLHGATVSSFADHRTLMSSLIAGLVAKGKVTVSGLSCINKSFPEFEKLLCGLKN